MATRNTLGDLHMMLMEQLQRLNECDVEELEAETQRADAMSDMGKTIIANANLILKANAQSAQAQSVPRILTDGGDDGVR